MIGNRQTLAWVHRTLGVLIVLLAVSFAWNLMAGNKATETSWSWRKYLMTPTPTCSIRVPQSSPLVVGDPLFLEYAPGQFHFAGDIFEVGTASQDGRVIRVHWRNSTPLPSSPLIEYYQTPRSLTWIAKTLLPPEKKEKVIKRIVTHYQAESPKINAKLVPVLRDVFEKSIPVIEKSAVAYVRSQRGRVQTLGQKYQETLVQKKLVPLLRRDVMPIVEKHASPVVESIGAELWDRASLWRFGWRYAYDVLPLTNRNLVQAEWHRFVENEAIPVVESHFDEFIEVQKRIILEATSNPSVRKAIQESMETLIDDRELQTLLGDILQHAVVNNQELHQVLQEAMTSEKAIALGKQFEESLQPLANDIGVELFGTETEGLTPELVAVLRSQILGKDQRWLVIRYQPMTEAINGDFPASGSPTGNLPSSNLPTKVAQREWVAVPGEGIPLFPFQNADLELKPAAAY
jgi:hypothetical protein